MIIIEGDGSLCYVTIYEGSKREYYCSYDIDLIPNKNDFNKYLNKIKDKKW